MIQNVWQDQESYGAIQNQYAAAARNWILSMTRIARYMKILTQAHTALHVVQDVLAIVIATL